MREGQQVSWKIKEGKAQTPLVHPGSLSVPEPEDPSALMGVEGGKQMAGLRRRRAEGLGDTTKKGGSRYRENTNNKKNERGDGKMSEDIGTSRSK